MATYDLTASIPSKIKTGDILNCPYSGTVKSIELPKGIYKLEVWGAQGGNSSGSSTYGIGGKGGYSVGVLNLSEKTVVYITVGGQGVKGVVSTRVSGGFNGGGDGYGTNSSGTGGGGGGGTDISLNQPSFSSSQYFVTYGMRDSSSLLSRIIVAGGGGSAGFNVASYTANGGVGGGLSGGDGISSRVYKGTGGTQTSGGNGGSSQDSNRYGMPAGFGYGAPASTSTDVAPGGGGGWYGGGTHCDSSGGGSGYVYTTETASNYPDGCLLNSSYYLTDAQTIAGNTSFLSPEGVSETGHAGNGYCRITVIDCSSIKTFIKKFGSWRELN